MVEQMGVSADIDAAKRLDPRGLVGETLPVHGIRIADGRQTGCTLGPGRGGSALR
jgi:hypothetical protein